MEKKENNNKKPSDPDIASVSLGVINVQTD